MLVPPHLDYPFGRVLVAAVAISASFSLHAAAQEGTAAQGEPSRWVGRVRFAGNDAVSERELRALARVKTGGRFSDEGLAATLTAIRRRYHEDGFLFAVVEATTESAVNESVHVTITINEERRYTVDEITIAGAEEVSAAEALRALEIRPRRLWGIVARGYYIPHRLEENLSLLRSWYRGQGYLQAEVALDDFTVDPAGRRVRLGIRVREGPRRKIARVHIGGNELFPTRLLRREAALEEGSFFSQAEVLAAVRGIARWYQERADLVPEVNVRYRLREADLVDVFLEVGEKEHLLTGTLEFSGNERTREHVLREQATLTPGGPFTILELEETGERIAALGLFADVEAVVEVGDDPNVRDVELRVAEREHWGWFEAGGGASSGGGELAYLGIRHDNLDLLRPPQGWDDWRGAFTGAGQRLEVQIAPGTKESNYRVRFEEPTFLRSDVSLAASAAAGIFERRSYDERHARTTVELRKYFDRDRRLSLALGYLLDRVHVGALDDDAPADVVAARGTTFLAYPRLELRFDDTRENYFSGPVGFRSLARLDLADDLTGSEEDFLRGQLRTDLFLPVWGRHPDFRHTLRLGFSLAGVSDLDGVDVPLFERFYLGGPDSFRGFAYRRLGPHQGTTPVGGQGILHGTVEYAFPLFWREVRAAALFDWGDNAPQFSRLSTGRFRTAIGGGLQLRLRLAGQPVPVNLYWVQALASEPEDREQLFSFSLGFSF